MNPYRCETCNHNDNHYCELVKSRLSFSDISTLEQFGCASHSDFQSEREKVLDELLEWIPEQAVSYDYGYYDPAVDVDELKKKIAELRQEGMVEKQHV